MCQYSAVDGLPNDWHLVHLGARAVGGAGLVMTEAAAISPEGRISPQDAGIWNSAQTEAWTRIVAFVHDQDTLAGVQLAHAGRKGSTYRPFGEGSGTVAEQDGGWRSLAPSAIAFGRYAVPDVLDVAGIATVVRDFVAAAERAERAGFDVVELHAAHGYLLHNFMSPLSNTRTDGFGGSFDNRVRLLLEVTDAVRAVWPQDKPLFVRISASDWTDGGWSVEDSVALAPLLAGRGVDLVDCSSGGLHHKQQIVVGPGYQVPFAEAVRDTGIPTAAVGLLTEAKQVEDILVAGQADAVFLARELLRDPSWPLRAATELGVDVTWPKQYERARP